MQYRGGHVSASAFPRVLFCIISVEQSTFFEYIKKKQQQQQLSLNINIIRFETSLI